MSGSRDKPEIETTDFEKAFEAVGGIRAYLDWVVTNPIDVQEHADLVSKVIAKYRRLN